MKKFTKNRIFAFILCLTFLLSVPCITFASAPDTASTKTNNYPIVLMHGLFGYGNDEFFGKNYWGGKFSIREDLIKEGYKEVYTPTLGSVSSNWDRACELYAYLKGGIADYGEAHSKKYGHARYGRTYPGVLKDWGQPGDHAKIHLVGHSMGGETIRVLVQLLENGDADECAATTSSTISPLFEGGKHWVDSVSTISTPEDGSQQAGLACSTGPLVHQSVAAIASVTGVSSSSDNPCFDYRLDQWGLQKRSDESFADYNKRVLSSKIWGNTKDLSDWDLSPEGAKELNSWVKAQSDVYYFSYSCSDTHKDPLTRHYVPNLNMSPILWKSSTYMGMHTNSNPFFVPITEDWWENDGIVSVRSAICPHEGSNDKVIDYNFKNPNPKKGVWNYLGKLDNIDHLQVVQMDKPADRERIEPKYFDLANILTHLPK